MRDLFEEFSNDPTLTRLIGLVLADHRVRGILAQDVKDDTDDTLGE